MTTLDAPLPRNRPPEAEFDPLPTRRQVSKELAQLEVRGKVFSNWTSVRVEQRWTEAFPTFQFECTEEVPVPLAINGAQFVPGDIVRVFLGGHQAVFGYITERHVAYDANSHGVKLVGVGDTYDLVSSSVTLDQLGGHDGQSVFQLAQSLAQHLGISIHRRGNVDDKPFENIQVLPGETPMQSIERYAKMRDILIGSLATGGLLLIGEHPAATVGSLWEGVHILRANCVVRDNMVFANHIAMGENIGSDKANGDPQNKMIASVPGSSTRPRVILVLADVADTRHGVERRAKMEQVFSQGSEVEAQITVQGWFKDNNTSDQIWRAGEYYAVDSPSLILNNEVLGCSGCVYEQTDSGGTTTTLTMVKPIHMNGFANFRAEMAVYARQRKAELDKKKAEAKAAADKLRQQGQQQ